MNLRIKEVLMQEEDTSCARAEKFTVHTAKSKHFLNLDCVKFKLKIN